MSRVPAIVAGCLIVLVSPFPVAATGQSLTTIRSDITTVFGYYGVTHKNSGRRFTTSWGNTYFKNGLGAHAEAHLMDREETAAFFATGLSWSGGLGEVRGWVGTSTENTSILPELYARFDASIPTDPDSGFVFRPAVTYREFRNGAREGIAEVEVAKYVPLQTGHLIFTLIARGIGIDPGRHFSASFGAGLLYVQTGQVSAGISIEGGRASYDGLLAPEESDESYFSIRPVVSFHLNDRLELLGMMEYSSRESYDVYGGHVGLKFSFD